MLFYIKYLLYFLNVFFSDLMGHLEYIRGDLYVNIVTIFALLEEIDEFFFLFDGYRIQIAMFLLFLSIYYIIVKVGVFL
jgi:hypothetical protein